MRRYIPANIFTILKSDFKNQAKYSIELHNRLWNKQALWLIRKDPSEILKLTHTELDRKYSATGQNFDIVEMSALYAILPQVMDNRFKEEWRAKIEKTLSVMWAMKKSNTLGEQKIRHSSYRNMRPMYS